MGKFTEAYRKDPLGIEKRLKGYARQMQLFPGTWEYELLDDMQDMGFLFQEVIGRRIADFYHPVHKIVVEIDGRHHYWPEDERVLLKHDHRRDAYLADHGVVRVLHFRNAEVEEEKQRVLEEIKLVLEDPTYPLPSQIEKYNPVRKKKKKKAKRPLKSKFWPFPHRSFKSESSQKGS